MSAEVEPLIVYSFGTHALAQFAACPRGTDPELFAVLGRCLALIEREHLPKPTEHRSLVFDETGSKFLGTWGNRRTDSPTRQKLISARQRTPFWKDPAA